MKMSKTLVLINPEAGGGRAAAMWRGVLDTRVGDTCVSKRCEFLEPFEEISSQKAGDITMLTREALKRGVDRILVVGGDGSLTEAANGFFENEKPLNPNATLGNFPVGTGCDFLKSLGINNLESALRHLEKGQRMACDVVKITYCDFDEKEQTRLFLNISSFGCSSQIVRKVAHSRKILGAKLTYFGAMVSTFLTYRNQTVELEIDSKEKREIAINNVFVCNGKYSGGGMCWGPKASLTDGLLDLTLVKKIPKIQGLLNMKKIYDGRALEFEGVERVLCQRVTARPWRARSGERVFIEVDGDVVGTLPATYQLFAYPIHIWC